jgi:hypothetical protein
MERDRTEIFLGVIRTAAGSVAKFDFRGKIRKLGISNSMTYGHQNSRKSNFATEPASYGDRGVELGGDAK